MYTKLLVAAIALTIPLATSAGESPQWYLGASAGQSEFKNLPGPDDIQNAIEELVDIGNATFPQQNSRDDTDTAWKLFGGYWFSPYLGVEFSCADLGEGDAAWSVVDLSGFPFYSGGKVSGAIDYSVTSAAVLGMARYPVLNFMSVFLKAGVHYYDAEATVTAAAEGLLFTDASATEKLDDSGAELIYGLGMEFNIAEQWGVRLEWERYDSATVEDADIDVDLLSAGLVFRF